MLPGFAAVANRSLALNQSIIYSRGGIRLAASGPEAVESPRILHDIMSQDVVVAVLRSHSKIGRIRRVPLTVQILDFVFVPAKNESQWPFVSAVAGIAPDTHFDHRSSHVRPRVLRVERSVAPI